jgi:activator of HSP90 ATPase
MSTPNTTVIEQTVTFRASAAALYDALLDSAKHSAFTGANATVSRAVGGAFACHDGCIQGVNVELVPDARIVQAWRGSMFPAGVYSVASFSFQPQADGTTKLAFRQVGVPEEFVAMISSGWDEHYWTPLAKFLEKQAKAA